MTSDEQAKFARLTFLIAGIILAMVLATMIFWKAASGFFLIFGGLLLGTAFSGLARLPRKLGLPRRAGLVLVYLVVVGGLAAAMAWGGITLVQQMQSLVRLMEEQLQTISGALRDMGINLGSEGQSADLASLLPNPAGIFSSASQAVFSILGGLGNLFVVVFIAIFVSWQPGLYARGIVSLFPKSKRPRIAETLHRAAQELILWLGGQGLSMTVIFLVGWIGLWLIGMPSAFLLALQAGLLAFIPTLGPFIAGIPIVLVGLAESPQMALYGLGVYLLIQGVESNVAQPVAQRWMTALPPALTLGSQLVFGLLFGTVGVALAVPVLAVIKVLVEELYIQDGLGGPALPEKDR
ncbi:AI-2E family transporter [Consotaella salsifontis]|uniref:Predicted PurR-regulated permease PerM n=1 Tax=Consotaella salsifontis TaxID=1365950 RepID=A0A1T4T517_9HYPH|nr:AI-2E family transporter [Consotaella salsifontis]SKA35497.1 Predicted PurR-regulated permease PerM [Consotaella salsifontis]